MVYKAVICEGQVKWEGTQPPEYDAEQSLSVYIMLAQEPSPREEFSSKLRPYGLAAGVFTVPEDFDASLPDEALENL